MRNPALAVLIGLAVALMSRASHAHDFWLDLDRWRIEDESGDIRARFLVGHAGDKEDWALKPERIVSLKSAGPNGEADQRAGIILPYADKQGGAVISLAGKGTHVIALETSNAAYSDLPAERFNAYIEEEGLTPAAEERIRRGASDQPGRERYSRRAKAIVQVGGDATSAAAVAPVGHTLEIVPLQNPFMLAKDEALQVEVRYEGKPLPNALIHFESLETGFIPEVKKRTDENGRASLEFPHRSAWKINVVWTKPIEGDAKADFETVFASLTFGY